MSASTKAVLSQALEALEESRDDVGECMVAMEHGKGYPKYDRRLSEYEAQLKRHDAAIASLRAALAEGEAEPVAWTLQSELDIRETTCRAHLWFSDPVNSAWTPLYTHPSPAALRAAVIEECAKVCETQSLSTLSAAQLHGSAFHIQEAATLSCAEHLAAAIRKLKEKA